MRTAVFLYAVLALSVAGCTPADKGAAGNEAAAGAAESSAVDRGPEWVVGEMPDPKYREPQPAPEEFVGKPVAPEHDTGTTPGGNGSQ